MKGAKRQPLLVEKRRSLSHNNIPLFFSDLASETAKTLIPEAGLRYPSLDPPSHQKRLPRGPLRFIVTIVFARWKRKQSKIKQGEREGFFPGITWNVIPFILLSLLIENSPFQVFPSFSIMILKALLFSLLALNLAEGAPIAKATSIHDHKMVRPNCSFIKKAAKNK